MDYPSEVITCYYTWIKKWRDHSRGVPTTVKVPSQASITPLIVHSWQKALFQHPNQPLVDFFLKGISQGFRIGFNHLPNGLKSAYKNLTGTLQHLQVVEEYKFFIIMLPALSIKTYVPFVQINIFGVIPKHPNKWYLIVDLSYPDHHSVDAGIPKSLCGLSYTPLTMLFKKSLSWVPTPCWQK